MQVAVSINQTKDPKVLDRCAQWMAASEPWISLGRDETACKIAMQGGEKEVYVASVQSALLGFVVLQMCGTFKGYIQSIFVVPEARSLGIGTVLLDYVENRIFQTSPNVFLCVSSFNDAARRLYERRGYEEVGVLEDFLIEGADEVLMRKSIGSLNTFKGTPKLL
ncbi:MAG: GNAT family N-acetyltransferase [Bacteroidetes Order II. Incertae sedis bacterium]|nr:GNAT family N-acetyltransferase [Bacteroidetes Order II. bacterium]